MKYIFFLLFITSLFFLSACKSMHEVNKVVQSANAFETSQSSAFTASYLSDFISAFSLQADSIVVWVQPEPSFSSTVFQDLADSTGNDTLDYKSNNSGLLSINNPNKSNSPHKALKIYGLNVASSVKDETSSFIKASDSVTAMANELFNAQEKNIKKPPEAIRVRCFVYGIIAFAVAIAIALIRRKMKK